MYHTSALRTTKTHLNIFRFSLAASLIHLIHLHPLPSLAAEQPRREVALTVYSHADPASFDPQSFIAAQQDGYSPEFASQVPGFGIVKEIRELNLKPGFNELRLADVAQFIDPTTVSLTDLDDPASSTILEQNFEFDLTSSEKMLQRFIDREITVLVPLGQKSELIQGRLLSAQGAELLIQTAAGLEIANRGGILRLGSLPQGLITRPTLVWKLNSKAGGSRNFRTTYQTDGITWRADYNLVLNVDDTKADISAWVTLMNLSGSSYNNARLKLIAGDVQRITSRVFRQDAYKALAASAVEEDAAFQQKPLFEYHLYTLPRRTDIITNSTQQITLFPQARGIKVEKTLVYYGLAPGQEWYFTPSPHVDRNLGLQTNAKVDVYVQFKNEKQSNLGIPLPRGRVRVFKEDDSDGTLEFIGEDLIDHTAKDEKVLIRLGQAFDVVGERTQTNYSSDMNNRTITESFKVELRNHKDKAQKVLIKENLYRWSNWEIIQKSDPFEKIDARTVHFNVEVPANGRKIVTYTVKYSW